MNKTTLTLITTLAALPLQAATYTWLGTAGDGDWNNSANWDGGSVPVDQSGSRAGLNLDNGDDIVFNGNAPTSNTPELGGFYATDGTQSHGNVPTLTFHTGGTYNLTLTDTSDGIWSHSGSRTVFTIGDGSGTAKTDVVFNLTMRGSLTRHAANITNTYIVNSDASFNITDTRSIFHWSSSDNRYANLILNGGDFSINTKISAIQYHNAVDPQAFDENIFVDFTGVGSNFTAKFAPATDILTGDRNTDTNIGDFKNEADVLAQMGANKFFRSSNGLTLDFTDNLDGTFTVSSSAAVPEPSATALLSIAGISILMRRRR